MPKYYEPKTPIGNNKLCEMVEGLTIRELREAGFLYISGTRNPDVVAIKSRYGKESPMILFRYWSVPPIEVGDNHYGDNDFDVESLEKLLKIELKEVCQKAQSRRKRKWQKI